ncbi:MAG: acriflavin resistance protein, partial [Chloroflexi bacterium]|nr:acriflavin resistance protein [Chloroflexota bacterium]
VGKRERAKTVQQLADDARAFGREIPGAVVKASVPSFAGGEGSPISVSIRGDDPKVIGTLASQVAEIVRTTPGTTDVSDGGVTGQPELVVRVDRDRAADLGLTPAQVGSVLRTGLAGSAVSTFRPEGTTGWDVSVILDPNERLRGQQVAEIPIITPRGSTVRLGQIADITTVAGPTQIDRRDRQRTVYVTAGLSGRVLGDVSKEVQAGIDSLQMPAGYSVKQGGAAEDQADSFAQIFQALGLSVLLMYMLMVALFESLVFPLVVMFSLPLAVVGAFGLLLLTGNTLNMMSLIGMILLTGLVGKNAILLVDYANTLRKRGMPRNDALLLAGPTRLRPILMTTAALVMAMLPIAAKLGEGSEWRAPMAITVIGGLITSSLLTLVLIPAVYTIMDDFQGLITGMPERARRLARWATKPRVSGRQPRPSPSQVPQPQPVSGGSE